MLFMLPLPGPFSEGFPTLWSFSGCHFLMRHSSNNHCKLANKFTPQVIPASHLICTFPLENFSLTHLVYCPFAFTTRI